MGARELSNEDALRRNMKPLKRAMDGKGYVPRAYVKAIQVAADTFLDVVNKAEVIARECLFQEILCLEGHGGRKYEEGILEKYRKAIDYMRGKMKEEVCAFCEEKVRYSTAEYVSEKEGLLEYYGKWNVEFPLEKFKAMRRSFMELIQESGVVKKSLLTLSNLGYQVPEFEYSSESVLLCDLRKKHGETMEIFRRNGIEFGEFVYFVRAGSEMFLFEFGEMTVKKLKTSEKSLEDFKGVFCSTCEFFHKVLRIENARFDVFEEIRTITEKFESTFDEELSIM